MFIDGQGNLYVGDMRVGDRAATPEEVAAWEAARTPDPVQLVKDQIAQIERDTLMNRAVRELSIFVTERETAREYGIDITTPENLELVRAGLYGGNPAYRRVRDIDADIAALRAQIGEA